MYYIVIIIVRQASFSATPVKYSNGAIAVKEESKIDLICFVYGFQKNTIKNGKYIWEGFFLNFY